jgi:hypothetical protein
MPKPLVLPQIYRDRDDLYLEFPTHVLRFAFTDAGLHKALRHIPDLSPPYPAQGSAEVANKLMPKPKIARRTAAARKLRTQQAALSPGLRGALDGIVHKLRTKT